jgi:hypothetical protein
MVEYCRVESAVLVYTKGKVSFLSDDNFSSYRLHRRKCTERSETRYEYFSSTENVFLLSIELDRLSAKQVVN